MQRFAFIVNFFFSLCCNVSLNIAIQHFDFLEDFFNAVQRRRSIAIAALRRKVLIEPIHQG